MINIIRNFLEDEEYNLNEFDNKVILYKEKANHFPEDYIEIEKEILTGIFTVYEIHRDARQIKLETKDEEEASICATILYKKLFDNVVNRVKARHIRNYIRSGQSEKALRCSIECFDRSVYSIGYEDPMKISLMQIGDKVDVKFGGEYLAESATLCRGYVVLYNYCEKLAYISAFYDRIQNQFKCIINREKIFKWYILGI
ncbi:hypothetical protein HB950_14175 [Listeria welshimeri]|nr:hypothetical protein [Listeria welshimeri]MBC1645630.1 hypothetical protein [Listeria welshimeri]MBC1659871.1 hypothetical protein [Listeria welshimeri]MBC1673463.1 hypothetical protein [Listeria welshimeri]